jgi:hypothetical protein
MRSCTWAAAYPDDGRNGAELAHKARQQMRPPRPA